MKKYFLPIIASLFLFASCTTITVPPSDLSSEITVEDSRGAIVTLQTLATVLEGSESLSKEDSDYNTAYVGLNFDMNNLKKKRIKINLTQILLKAVDSEGNFVKVWAVEPYAISSLGSGKLTNLPRKGIKTMQASQYYHMYYIYPKGCELVSITLDDKTEILISNDKNKYVLTPGRVISYDKSKKHDVLSYFNSTSDGDVKNISALSMLNDGQFGKVRYSESELKGDHYEESAYSLILVTNFPVGTELVDKDSNDSMLIKDKKDGEYFIEGDNISFVFGDDITKTSITDNEFTFNNKTYKLDTSSK